ncbi:MAG TPA: hypothetical protein VGA59_18050 [Ramlibacter sp.]
MTSPFSSARCARTFPWSPVTFTFDGSLAFCAALEYHCFMQLATGTVIDGKVVIEGLALPEGTVVTVLTRDDEQAVRLSPAEEAQLLEALDEADREEGISAEELFARLQRFG